MSTQFRSRIKTVIDDKQNDASTGVCCLADGSKVESTVNECTSLGGYFQQGEINDVQCPSRGLTGCCCSCSNVRAQDGDFENYFTATGIDSGIPNEDNDFYDTSLIDPDNANSIGLKDNVTQCECFRSSGQWFYGKCSEVSSISALCGSVVNNTDTRTPAACCHGNTFTDQLDCSNVCTLTECQNLRSEDYPFSEYSGIENSSTGALCDLEYFGNPPKRSECEGNIQRLPSQRVANNPQLFPCLELKTSNNQLVHECSQKTPVECFNAKGFQYPRYGDSLTKCSETISYPPKRGSGALRVSPATIPGSALPEVGTIFQGGIYLGIFDVNQGKVTKRLGANLTEDPVRFFGNGTSQTRWALIYSLRPYHNQFDRVSRLPMEPSSRNHLPQMTSFYDGFFNTRGDGVSFMGYKSDLFEKIRNWVWSGFNDWYVPSADELSFIFKNQGILFTPSARDKTGNLNTSYQRGNNPFFEYTNMLSSTLYSENDNLQTGVSNGEGQLINGFGYYYGQNMSKSNIENNGKVFIQRRDFANIVPVVRRYYIE